MHFNFLTVLFLEFINLQGTVTVVNVTAIRYVKTQ